MSRKNRKQNRSSQDPEYRPDPTKLEEFASRIRPLAQLRVRLNYLFLLILLILGAPRSITGMLYFIIGTVFIMTGSFQRFGAAATLVKASGRKEEGLVTEGPYEKSRHPLYFGSFLQGLGFVLMAGPFSDVIRNIWPSVADNYIALIPWAIVPFLLILVPVYGRMMNTEEDYLREKFGPLYLRYQVSTPRFIPKLNLLTRDPNWVYDSEKLKENRERRNFTGLMLVWVLFFAKMLYFLFTSIGNT